MDISTIRDYCLSLPLATEDTAFGDDILLFRVCDKIFACVSIDRPDLFVVKCDPDYAIELRDKYSEIAPAWHWNKKYWIEVSLRGELSERFMFDLIRHSYAQVVKKLPKKLRLSYPEICIVDN